MKAVVAALVLIAGAAVVLWYGNTLNSWVLGGLIGGLAALLISIPISLVFFSYLSRQHEEIREEERDEVTWSRVDEYRDLPPATARREYAVEGSLHAIDEDDQWYKARNTTRRMRSTRALHPMLPSPHIAGGAKKRVSRKLPVARYEQEESLLKEVLPPSGNLDSRGPRTTQRLQASSNLYGSSSQMSRYRSNALRTARLEAAKQQEDNWED